MKKKIFSAVCALLLVMGAASPLTNAGSFADLDIIASAEEEYNGFSFAENEDGTLTAYYDARFDTTVTDVTVPSTCDGKKVTSICYSAFFKCENLKSITIPDTVTSIGDCAFSGCSSLKSINIPAGITSIGTSWFENCTSLESITLPESVTDIGYSAFAGCENLKDINIPQGVTSIGISAFGGCESLESINLPNTLTSIGEGAFNCCFALTSITIPNGVTSIGDWTFAGCTSLKTINIPGSVTSMNKEAFEYYSSLWKNDALTSINVDENNPAFSSVDGVLYNKDKTEMIYCPRGITILKVPSSVTSLDYLVWFWDRDAFEGFDVDENNPNYSSVDGVLYNKDKTQLLCCPNAKESITMPNSVTSIGEEAFSNCNSLKSIAVDTGNASYASVDGVLYNKDKTKLIYCPKFVERVNIPNSVTSIGEDAFSGCTSLKSITIPNGVTSIGEDAFRGCTSLTNVTIPNSVKSIGNEAFLYTPKLKSVIIPGSVKEIGEKSFGYYWNMGQDVKLEGFTIYGESGSAAEKYAKDNGFKFVIKTSSLGDVNADSTIDVEDAVMIINNVNGQKALTDEEAKRSDIDGNSAVDIEDAVAIISHVNGVKAIV